MVDDRKLVILAIGAHPDDIDFAAAATLAKWVKEGHTVYGAVSTSGNRGSRQHVIAEEDLVTERHQEQLDAAKIIGIKEVFFLDREDGNLVADIQFKEEIVRLIRKLKPDRVITHDPSYFYKIGEEYSHVNHNDHRKTGEAVLDAVYPLARDNSSFPHHAAEGLTPHTVPEVYLFNYDDPNYIEDVTETLEIKIAAVNAHKSQVDDPDKTHEWVEKHLGKLGEKAGYKYAEGFTKLVLR